MPNLELYRIFKVVADEGNLTKASQKLFISQPAVTQHIHNLEDELNIKLFERTQHGITLTKEGENIYNQIKEPISILSSIKDSLENITNIKLGIHTNFTNDFYGSILKQLAETNPNIDFSIYKSDSERMFAMLEKNEIDAYLSKEQPEDIHSQSIKFISLGALHDNFFVNSDSKFLGKNISKLDTLTIYTLNNISSTSRRLKSAIEQNNYNNIVIKNYTFITILEKLQYNDVIAYITEEYIQKELNEGKFKKLDLGIEIQNDVNYGIYYNSNNKLKNIKTIFEKLKSQI